MKGFKWRDLKCKTQVAPIKWRDLELCLNVSTTAICYNSYVWKKGLKNLWSSSLYGRLLDLIGTKQQYKYEIWIWNKCCYQSLSHSNAFVLRILLVPVLVKLLLGALIPRSVCLSVLKKYKKITKLYRALENIAEQIKMSKNNANRQSK